MKMMHCLQVLHRDSDTCQSRIWAVFWAVIRGNLVTLLFPRLGHKEAVWVSAVDDKTSLLALLEMHSQRVYLHRLSPTRMLGKEDSLQHQTQLLETISGYNLQLRRYQKWTRQASKMQILDNQISLAKLCKEIRAEQISWIRQWLLLQSSHPRLLIDQPILLDRRYQLNQWPPSKTPLQINKANSLRRINQSSHLFKGQPQLEAIVSPLLAVEEQLMTWVNSDAMEAPNPLSTQLSVTQLPTLEAHLSLEIQDTHLCSDLKIASI